MSNNPRRATPPPAATAAAPTTSSSAPLAPRLPVTAEPLPAVAEQPAVVDRPSFPYPIHHWQPRRHFSGVGYFGNPAQGRTLTESIFENAAHLYPSVRHHHIRMTTITAAGDRTMYRAALFLVDQPQRLTYDMRGVPGGASSNGNSSIVMTSQGHGSGGGGVGARVIHYGRGHGQGGGVAVENGSGSGGGSGNGCANGSAYGAANGAANNNGSSNGDDEDEDEDNDDDEYSGPYSSGIPEYRQRLALVGTVGQTIDEAMQGLERVVVRERERRIA